MLSNKRVPTLLLALLCLISIVAAAQAQDTAVLTDTQDRYPLGLHLEILEDKEKQWTIKDVTSPEIASQFVPSQDEVPNFGFTDSAFWVRFRVEDLAEEPLKWLLSVKSNLFFIDVYVPTPDSGQYQVTQTGTILPFNTREIEHPGFLFNLPLAPGEEQEIYLRLESEAAMNISLAIRSAESVAQDDLFQQVLNGFIYGVLFIMAGYNFILFLYLKDSSYLYYVLLLFFLLLAFMVDDGFAHQYLWPGQGRLNAIGGQLFFVLVIMAALKFTTSFLPTKENSPRIHEAINILFIAYCVLLPILLINLGIAARPNLILTIASYLVIVSAGIVSWRQGYRPARYYLLAWLLLLTSMLIFAISRFGFLPLGNFAAAGSQIGVVVLTLALSLALADRISTYRQEKDSAQEEVLRNQEAFAESLRQANVDLEEQFEARTLELSFAQEQIDLIFQNSPLGFGTADMNGRVMTANDALKNILGYPDDTIFQAHVPDFFADQAQREEITARLATDNIVQVPAVQLRRSDGTLFFANLTENVFSREGQDVLLGIVDDITDRVLAEQALQKEAEKTAVEEERNRIARELHDSVTQTIYSASLIAEAVPKYWQEHPEEAQQDLNDLHALTLGAQAELRTLLLELRPGELVDRSLSDLLRQLVDAMSGRTGLQISLTVAGDCNLPANVQIAYYRIAQEALNNIVKHAKAERAWINLRCDEERVVMRIGDSGRGFDIELRQSHQLGLYILQERAEAIDADLSIESVADQGTEVTAVWRRSE